MGRAYKKVNHHNRKSIYWCSFKKAFVSVSKAFTHCKQVKCKNFTILSFAQMEDLAKKHYAEF